MEPFPEQALSTGDLPAVDTWLTAGGDVDARDPLGNTPLCLAARHGHAALVRRLLDAGADRDAVGMWVGRVAMTRGFTPLLLALEAGHQDVANQLLDGGARADVADETGATSLTVSARSAPAVLPRLLAAGVDPDAADEDGWTPLMHAVAIGPLEAVDALLSAGAGPDARSEDGETALSLAVEERRPEVVERLVAAGADPGGRSVEELVADAQGRDGYTLADARAMLLEYEAGVPDPEAGLEEALQDELAILLCERGVAVPAGGVDLEITGPEGAAIHVRNLDAESTIYGLGPLEDPDLRITIPGATHRRLDPAGGDIHRWIYEASRGFSFRMDHLADLLASPHLDTWCRRGGTLVCRLAEAPDATLAIRIAPAREGRACALTFRLDAVCAWLRRELTPAQLLQRASVGGPDEELAKLFVADLS